MSVSIPAPQGGWKEPPPRRSAPIEVYPQAPVVAAAAVEGLEPAMKKKKSRSLRRCMDREKHSKAEQKRRGEMKALFDELQEISNCVYKDRIHILTLAIQTIQQQKETITALQSGVKKEKIVKGDEKVASSVSPSSTSSSPTPSTTSQQPVDLPVKLEARSPKRQRTGPPSDVVDLSTVAEAQKSSSEPSSLASSASCASLSTFVAGHGVDFSWGIDEHWEGEHGKTVNVSSTTSYPLMPCVSPAPFPFQSQENWWPTADTVRKQ
jgi:hypothetical protein